MYVKYQEASYNLRFRPVGRCKILGVLMTSCGALRTDLKISGVLNVTFYLILRNIGGAIAPPFPSALRRTMFEIGPKRSETLVGIPCSSWQSFTLVCNHFGDQELKLAIIFQNIEL